MKRPARKAWCTLVLSCWAVHKGYLGSEPVSAFQTSGKRRKHDIHFHLPSATVKQTQKHFTTTHLFQYSYGRGAEIWPPKNTDRPVRLQDSFPVDGQIPQLMQEPIKDYSTQESFSDPLDSVSPPSRAVSSIKRKRKRERVWSILKRAARYERVAALNEGSLSMEYIPEISTISLEERKRIDQSPAFLALFLVFMRVVPPKELLFVVATSAYLAVLYQICQTRTEQSIFGGKKVRMPALPPQGHVPSLLANPLGYSLTESYIYRLWLITGAIFGLIIPLGSIMFQVLIRRQRDTTALLCAGPVFLICCQAWTESVFRQLAVPLPLRILVPLIFNTRRIGSLWEWAFAPSLGIFSRTLGLLNYLYWSVNLFGFLLPIAALRYIRAYCFCVEASEVTMREGHEDSAGLLPRLSR